MEFWNTEHDVGINYLKKKKIGKRQKKKKKSGNRRERWLLHKENRAEGCTLVGGVHVSASGHATHPPFLSYSLPRLPPEINHHNLMELHVLEFFLNWITKL